MTRIERHQILPRAGESREQLRMKGQFWTPDWVADAMIAYALADRPGALLDPALGEGVFFRAALRYAGQHGFAVRLFGREIDPHVLPHARASGLTKTDLDNVELRDFVLDPPSEVFPAIVANPPYLRHHRLPPEQKSALRDFARRTTVLRIDARAGLHVYFFIRALERLAPGGRLAFIVSADIAEGVFADRLWRWVAARFRIDAVCTFTRDATPLPDVDTNALLFCIRNGRPTSKLHWIRCGTRNADALTSAIAGRGARLPSIEKCTRHLAEALETGLSRPAEFGGCSGFALSDFATVMRGIVTGDNDFFFLTAQRAREAGLPLNLFVRAVGRLRDVEGEEITPRDLERLEAAGRPTWLLSLNEGHRDALPGAVQQYLAEGERRGLTQKTLIRTRNPWYRMETRKVPPILFAYLGRRHARFIRNRAGVVPLTCLLCVYPRRDDPAFLQGLWSVLAHPETVANLRKVGKSYGGDAIKVEPRALERLPLPEHLVREHLLERFPPAGCEQLDLGI